MNQTLNQIPGFDRVNLSRWRLYVNKDFPTAQIAASLQLDEEFDGVRGPFVEVPASVSARVWKCSVNFAGRCYQLYLKQYLYRSAWDVIKHLFRSCRAKRALKASIVLSENGLQSPEIIAMGRLQYGIFCAKNFLITRELANAKDISAWLGEEESDDRRRFVKALGRTIGKMHCAGIFHGDLRSGNILAKKNDDRWQFFFLDNERTRKFRTLPDRLRLKNLVQINMLPEGTVNTVDRMRFFKAYLAENPKIQKQYKSLAATVAAKTARRMRGKE